MSLRTFEPRTMKVTKCAERKVNLDGISSKYDNISWSTFISHEFDFSSEEEYEERIQEISDKAVFQVEKDIRNNLIMLKVMAEDINNDALLGTGPNLEYSEEEAEGMRVFIARIQKLEKRKQVKQIDKAVTNSPSKKDTTTELLDSDDGEDFLFGEEESGTEDGDVEIVVDDSSAIVTTDDDIGLFDDDDDEPESTTEPDKKEPELALTIEDPEDVDLDDFNFDDFTDGLLDD